MAPETKLTIGEEYIAGIPLYLPGEIHAVTVFKGIRSSGVDPLALAHTIAAAPELLAGLAEALSDCETSLRALGWTETRIASDEKLNRYRAAIAKADSRP